MISDGTTASRPKHTLNDNVLSTDHIEWARKMRKRTKARRRWLKAVAERRTTLHHCPGSSFEVCGWMTGGISVSANVKFEAIDGEKSVTYVILDGDLMQLYKSFKGTVIVSDGSVKWHFKYEKILEIVPIPEVCAALAIEVTEVVDLVI
ncbi:unnamed protein product [Fraxinus pennsylvanica]|uniref:Bet v I/Major latex protein domain-containing protein n=1 Tax=Fraxinus pennsylvanica TaxID=56036 RepID=A0AAD2A865_9LAMI|nr:unnamed protein product [Fraxinus pennsylvanica]